jgi:hypothetical protein
VNRPAGSADFARFAGFRFVARPIDDRHHGRLHGCGAKQQKGQQKKGAACHGAIIPANRMPSSTAGMAIQF